MMQTYLGVWLHQASPMLSQVLLDLRAVRLTARSSLCLAEFPLELGSNAEGERVILSCSKGRSLRRFACTLPATT